jgi:hypothetical protein
MLRNYSFNSFETLKKYISPFFSNWVPKMVTQVCLNPHFVHRKHFIIEEISGVLLVEEGWRMIHF